MDASVNTLLEDLDTGALQEMAPEIDLRSILQSTALGESLFDPQTLLKSIAKIGTEALRDALPHCMRMVGLGILGAGLSHVLTGHQAGDLCEWIGCVCAALMLSAQTAELFSLARQTMQRMTDFTAAVLPSLLALMTACGAAQSAAGLQKLTLAATGGLTEFFHNVLLTLTACAAVMMLADAVQDGARLKSMGKLLRNAVHWLVGICFTVFVGCIAVQTGAGAHYDGVALRVTKFAADKTVPIVGGFFKDAADTFIGCALIVKNALGTAGLAAVTVMLALPALRVLSVVVASRLCADVLDLFGSDRIGRMLDGMADVQLTVMLLMMGCALMCLVPVAAAMYTGMEFL